MTKIKHITDDVFTNVIRSEAYKEFITVDDDEKIDGLKKLYVELIEDNLLGLEEIAGVEELIIQMRCKINAESCDVKLSIVKGYIYARVPFFKPGKKLKDIRVVVGNTTEYGDNITKLSKNKTFILNSRVLLLKAMGQEILKSKFIKKLKSLSIVDSK